MENENYYKTSDLALATTLSLFCPIESMDRSDPHRAFFIFKRGKDLDEIVESFWHKKLKIEPQEFFNQLKNIKTRIYASS